MEFYDYLVREYDRMKKNSLFPEDLSFTKVTKVIAKNMQQQKEQKKERESSSKDMDYIKF
jgi:hypothetical protein